MPGVDVSATQDKQFDSELVERWIMDLSLSLMESNSDYFNLTLVRPKPFAEHLQMAINAFWDSTIGSEIRMGRLDPITVSSFSTSWDEVNIRVTRNEGLHYVCNSKFAGITMAISVILLLAATLSMLLGLFTRASDTPGFVSLALRENPHFKKYVPSYLDGKVVARLLRDVKVVIGDVNGD